MASKTFFAAAASSGGTPLQTTRGKTARERSTSSVRSRFSAVTSSTTSIAPIGSLLTLTRGTSVRLTEAFSPQEETYGEERLVKLLQQMPLLAARGRLDAIEAAISRFMGPLSVSDDLTMLAVQHFDRGGSIPPGARKAVNLAGVTLFNAAWLADIARSMNLGDHLQLGKGEELTGGREKESILAGAFEALLGAIYLDGGFDAVMTVVKRGFEKQIEGLAASNLNRNYKSLLQEFAQAAYKTPPVYEIISESGPDHDKRFCCRVCVGAVAAEGVGRNKKMAQQDAARKAMILLNPNTL